MAQKKKTDDSYEKFIASYKAGEIGNFYILHGDERYLLDHSLSEIRKKLCPDGLNGFNYRRFEGRNISLEELDAAINTLPFFADRTLVEIHDIILFPQSRKSSADNESDGTAGSVIEDDSASDSDEQDADNNAERQHLLQILSNLPEHVCLVIVFNTLPFKPDSRLKHDKEILRLARVVNFTIQDQAKLLNWIHRRFEAEGKRINRSDAEYLALITDGLMTSLVGEIGKVSAYSQGETVTRADIDAVVTPVPNAIAYKLSDALLAGKHTEAMHILDGLFQMREPAQRIIFNISMKMRHFLAARICIEENLGKRKLIELCGFRYDFLATILLDAARNATLEKCRSAVLLCSGAAYDINNTNEPEARLVELLAQLTWGSARV